jgi:hypothetical protein
MPVIWVGRKQEYFSDEDWTGQIRLICLKKFGCSRKACSGLALWMQTELNALSPN